MFYLYEIHYYCVNFCFPKILEKLLVLFPCCSPEVYFYTLAEFIWYKNIQCRDYEGGNSSSLLCKKINQYFIKCQNTYRDYFDEYQFKVALNKMMMMTIMMTTEMRMTLVISGQTQETKFQSFSKLAEAMKEIPIISYSHPIRLRNNSCYLIFFF